MLRLMALEPLARMSGEFCGAAVNYPVVETEAFAIREGMCGHKHLFRSLKPVIVFKFTDHKNL